MDASEFEDGYLGGWASVAGNAPPPPSPTCPPADQRGGNSPFALGYEYGRSDALERVKAVSGFQSDLALAIEGGSEQTPDLGLSPQCVRTRRKALLSRRELELMP